MQSGYRALREHGRLFPQICRDAVQFRGVNMAWVGLVDEANRRVNPVASYGDGMEYLEGIQISVDGADPATAPWHEKGARSGWGASASLPLRRYGAAVGAITLYAGETDFFDEAERNLLVEMAMDISYALDNFAREAEIKKSTEALQLSEKHFRACFDRAMIGMAATSPGKNWIEINDALCEMLGYSREELMQMTWADITRTDDLAANLIQFDRILSGEIDEYSIKNRFVRKDGIIVHARRSPRAVLKSDGSLDYQSGRQSWIANHCRRSGNRRAAEVFA